MRKVLITIPVEERHKEYFENIGKDCAFEYVQSSEVSREQVRDASIIIGNVPAEMLHQFFHISVGNEQGTHGNYNHQKNTHAKHSSHAVRKCSHSCSIFNAEQV